MYDDYFARYTMMPIFAAVYTPNPQDCFDNVLPTLKFYKSTRVKCYKEGPETTCHAYTAYDTSRKAIVISVEGTDGAVQMTEEVLSFFQEKVPFYENGRLFKYFNQAFFDLWNGGLETNFRALKYLYPDYEIWIAGHSLGAGIASIAASYIVKFGLATGENIKLVTIGQPRTGDREWAEWHENTFPYSYRIVHHRDPVPHVRF
ncbi:hypothetical protein WR25_04857 [Diploscapter pachys]|uniref:Fungal lipase-type domain-containing protein n=1 Tax=Diploscapter pachys TaxID=2018661 RepID=A0A2A2LXF8_9BILA|nr:hypothetical protein WR25_04857 [Diploscapter pachys]